MAWRHMRLRGDRVLARCDAQGELSVTDGKVEIRYRPGDGKMYQAAARNLDPDLDATVLPDGHCAPAEAPQKKAKPASKTKGGGTFPTLPEGKTILVYADGACSGNPGPAGLGVVMRWDEGEKELSEYLGHGTNNIAELTAILRAAEGTPDRARPMRLYTDSSYAIGVLAKGWKAKANQALVASAKEALARLDDVELLYVPGHAGVSLNERADALAVEAVSSRATAGWMQRR